MPIRKLLNFGKSRSKDSVDRGPENFQLCKMTVVSGFGTVNFMPVMSGTRGQCEREAARLGSDYRIFYIS